MENVFCESHFTPQALPSSLSRLEQLPLLANVSWLRVVERGLYPAGRRARARLGAIDWQARCHHSSRPISRLGRQARRRRHCTITRFVHEQTDLSWQSFVQSIPLPSPNVFSPRFLPTITMSRAHSVLPSRGIVPQTQAKHFWVAFSHREIGYPRVGRTYRCRQES